LPIENDDSDLEIFLPTIKGMILGEKLIEKIRTGSLSE